ncbi:probable DNA primase large subunit [Physcomitrium patens]|uniref:DNA primase large subunit n=1 Tax=Physcomitrium patens TaxID=3218 RepID=A0A2K1J476_PHYPA|nr:probable DNA primase large subunit [Physcomitrium patens]PNR36310.1 hypothetical protein PHYPA_022161 [Physcomitrium patens]|eukprot:XP_024400184.1 probable DNA primase large subunit [Physcomitrella patens]
MEFRSRASHVKLNGAVKAYGVGGGGSRVSMYLVAPDVDVSLEDFEQYALDRLRVLIAIEENRSRGKRAEEVDSAVSDLWKKHMRTVHSDAQQQKDVISHFVLRLVHCRTEELRRWFMEMETALFRFRFKAESPESQKAFIEDHKLPYKSISSGEFEAMKEKLAQVMRSSNQSASLIGETNFYKVPFEEVLDLVATRRVYVHQGHAFVPRDQLVTIVSNHFRSMLSQSLILTNRNWTAMFAAQEEDRLSPILEALSKRYLAPDYSKSVSGSSVALQDLDGLAMRSFPLCMRHLYLKLQEDHHLRHGGRQQLGLFLKGIGLKLEDALAFWRGAFAPRMPAEKFDKEYAYNVRHNYGKEGKRTDYTPYSCMYIIMSNPGVGDHHGCPFRHFSAENLHAALSGMRLEPKTIDEVMEKTRGRHYQLACAATFEGSHNCQCDGINHPNQYFSQSQNYLKEQAENASQMETDS